MQSDQKKSFWALIVTQFFGAFNDNVLKVLVALLVVEWVTDPVRENTLVSLSGAVFVAPFLLFSMIAGRVSDRMGKPRVAVLTKYWEFLVILAAIASLWAKSIPAMMGALFMLSMQATFFSPAKYGVLPEMMGEADLPAANAYLNIATFAAILIGTLTGSFLTGHLPWAYAIMAVASVAGLVASFSIAALPAAKPGEALAWNPVADLIANWKIIRQDRSLKLGILAVNYFWFMGALMQLNVFLYAKQMMGVSDKVAGVLVIAVAIGVGVGSWLCSRLSEGRVELGLVPLGALGMSLFAMDLQWAYDSKIRTFFDFFMLGFSGGVYDIPLMALTQWRSPKAERGRVLATVNFLSFVAILAASGALWLFGTPLRLNPAQVFFVVGVASLAGSVVVYSFIPDALWRLVLYLMVNVIYRIRVIGAGNIPMKGPALLVSNHLSLADGFLVGGALSRLVRFLIWKPYYEARPWHWLLKTMKAIPISEKDPPKDILRSLLEARKALQEGDLVCIFAEGQVSRTGNLLEFKKGFEVIVKDLDVPVIPVCLDRVWGSIFSFEHGKVIFKKPRRIPYPVTVTFGSPVRAPDTRQAVMDLGAASFVHRLEEKSSLAVEFLKRAKRQPRALAVADSTGKELSYGQLAAVSFALSILLHKLLSRAGPPSSSSPAAASRPVSIGSEAVLLERTGGMVSGGSMDSPSKAAGNDGIGLESVGILLPPSVAGALANIAVSLLGRVPVNLNYTAGTAAIQAAVQKAGIARIITSRKLLEKTRIAAAPDMIYMEEVMALLPKRRVLLERFLFSVMPIGRVIRRYTPSPAVPLDAVATIMFSSGSTGIPKGVVLSHANILSNILGLSQVFDLGRKDRMLGALPFFHSFGFTGTLWFPLISGFSAVYHANPLDAKVVGELAKKYKTTLLLATPTFLSAYARKCAPEQFRSLRYVIAGAERLQESIAKAFEEKFGIAPLEGYGCTELSPVACVNVPNVSMGEIHQVGRKAGTIGHPIPGVTICVVDPDTFEPRPQGETGLLLVKGPNVMKGYLGEPEKTAEVIRDGWYVTGDIAKIDPDGFVQLVDRLSRFSKIGGEMVPHVLVEEKLHQVAGRTEPTFVVTGVPDEKRGEQLVVLYSGGDSDIDDLWEKLNDSDLPKLWIPPKENFLAIPEIPYLGSGKLDLSKIKEIVMAKKSKNPESDSGF